MRMRLGLDLTAFYRVSAGARGESELGILGKMGGNEREAMDVGTISRLRIEDRRREER